MKAFLIGLILLTSTLISTAAADSAGVFFEPTRNGEGAAVFTEGESFTAFIYTYRDGNNTLPPVVGPAPPRVENRATNSTTWYVAQSVNFDGSTATGEIYSAEAIDYPFSFDDTVGAIEQVGEFTASKTGQGWDISVTYTVNALVDVSDSLYIADFQFRVPLIIHE